MDIFANTSPAAIPSELLSAQTALLAAITQANLPNTRENCLDSWAALQPYLLSCCCSNNINVAMNVLAIIAQLLPQLTVADRNGWVAVLAELLETSAPRSQTITNRLTVYKVLCETVRACVHADRLGMTPDVWQQYHYQYLADRSDKQLYNESLRLLNDLCKHVNADANIAAHCTHALTMMAESGDVFHFADAYIIISQWVDRAAYLLHPFLQGENPQSVGSDPASSPLITMAHLYQQAAAQLDNTETSAFLGRLLEWLQTSSTSLLLDSAWDRLFALPQYDQHQMQLACILCKQAPTVQRLNFLFEIGFPLILDANPRHAAEILVAQNDAIHDQWTSPARGSLEIFQNMTAVLEMFLVSSYPGARAAVLELLLRLAEATSVDANHQQSNLLRSLCSELRVPRLCSQQLNATMVEVQPCVLLLYAHWVLQLSGESPRSDISELRQHLCRIIAQPEELLPVDDIFDEASASFDLRGEACSAMWLDFRLHGDLTTYQHVRLDLMNKYDVLSGSSREDCRQLLKAMDVALPMPALDASKRQNVIDELEAYRAGVDLRDMVPDCC
eukprot:TRINITY_DN10600_c0_g1_i1.p1 TRINITY_DN10600_c0_g1~~TRINITY_DN10600_c0_g1_i1.p1  ORF type:complete len:651 (+),score=96.43 TRINITY_DN10600_c0_g1_i1:272-1954(+)